MDVPSLRTTVIISCLCGVWSGAAGTWVAFRAIDHGAKEVEVLRVEQGNGAVWTAP